ncbi:MAG: aminoacetone oxidase family FAD-binding enzyme [Bacillus sp. (in: Bacteria)]|nr:aminoacetone oxidase family FAD-binding enzyme [Bacillus sp. (in: firmicutes)]MCM1426811.1 aminoacetone oxidase family FAD-binding enzyme [Eubacterium sp.]
MSKQVAVIGGGAAGMMAAIQAAGAGASVDLYEKNDRVGKKLLVTGNGKCNFSNLDMKKDAYYGSGVSLYDDLFSAFGLDDTIDFFSQHGMLIKDRNGYLYPLSEQASTVLDVLRYALDACHVNVCLDNAVTALHTQAETGKITLTFLSGKRTYDAVVLACGGMAAPKTGSDGSGFALAGQAGHHVTPLVPALVQLRCEEDFFKSVSGVRTEAKLTLLTDGHKADTVQGELQLTDYGISGIPVFQFSRQAAYALYQKKKVTVAIDFLPNCNGHAYDGFWEERWIRQKTQPLEQFLTGISNKKINRLIIKLAGCRAQETVETLSLKKRKAIQDLYKNLTVSVRETNGFEHAQVSAGGIPAKELTKYLESKYMPHLFFAGEIIDMDGICGGYNLQWAWTSGAIAGRNAAGA